MIFIYKPELWHDSPDTQHWFSCGDETTRYKITFYDQFENDDTITKAHYKAYFKPDGWLNFGMGCEKGNPSYNTLENAQAACETHALIGNYKYPR